MSASSAKNPETQSQKWRQIFAEVRPNSHMLPSRTFGWIVWRNFGICQTSGHL